MVEYRNALKQILAYPFPIIRAAATLWKDVAMRTRKRNNGMRILISISLSREAATLWADIAMKLKDRGLLTLLFLIRVAATLWKDVVMRTRKRDNGMLILILISLSRAADTLWAVGWV